VEATIMNKVIGLVVLAGVSAVGVACGGENSGVKPTDPTTTSSTTTTTTAPPPAAASTSTTTTTTTEKK
jgi:hypothetical protein